MRRTPIWLLKQSRLHDDFPADKPYHLGFIVKLSLATLWRRIDDFHLAFLLKKPQSLLVSICWGMNENKLLRRPHAHLTPIQSFHEFGCQVLIAICEQRAGRMGMFV